MNDVSDKEYFEKQWIELYFPEIQKLYESDGVPDYTARREDWNNYIDAAMQDGDAPEEAEGWELPPGFDNDD